MEFETARLKAIKYIGISKKTTQEVINKLYRCGFEDDIIAKVIDYLIELDYLNDEEYIDAYIRQCVRLLNYSIFEIKQKLLQKGIKKDIIETKLSKLENSDYETKLIDKLKSTKLKNMDDIKQKQYLYRRGLKLNDF